ncbi:metallophosphoesterase [Psychromarinibacter sp. C21-152]|uniref:Metallophosphoesterase n=1 Tax=Psychromarinibacter sediminicola TaxID=3033385 RepID=A0AAE3TB34_9RHOB|nr:metallophosphoesterase [Psychromarinibacter sediminicola]MDF0602619.1 metallophosphoesterase [Psychromarinibacter sediminicola]
MQRIVHLSDLHFGRARPEVLTPLLSAVAEAVPDLVVVSGDLTQRARPREFREARAFLDRLPAPWLAVPGNHDVPLYNLGQRLLRPYARYRRWIGQTLAPQLVNAQVAVVGLNTVDPRRHQRGEVRSADIARLCATFGTGPPERLNIAVGHHPFEQGAHIDKSPTRHATRGLARLTECNAHVILSGHLHLWHAGPFLTNARGAGPIQVHAGTSLSSRLRGEVNDFALLGIDAERLSVTRMVYDDTARGFAAADRLWFRRGAEGLSLEDARDL